MKKKPKKITKKDIDYAASPSAVFGEWQLCPMCLGEKMIRNNRFGYTDSNILKQCSICLGLGVLARPVINQPNQ